MREKMNQEEREASHILDLVRAGGDAPESAIRWALWVLGDLERRYECTTTESYPTMWHWQHIQRGKRMCGTEFNKWQANTQSCTGHCRAI